MRWRWTLFLVVLLVICGVAWWKSAFGAPGLGQAAYEQTAAILAKGPRPPESAALKAVTAHVKEELEKAGWVTAAQPFERSTPDGNMHFENLRARFPAGGGDPWSQPVQGILCAHIDSKLFKDVSFVGADDAASACAAIVEIAKYLAKKKPAQAKGLELAFFDGEESIGANITASDGLYGSRHYANQWRSQPAKPKFGILLDMIGHESLSIKLSNDTPPDLKARVMDAAKAEGVDNHYSMSASDIIDDHVPLNSAGIPTVDVIGDFSTGGWWHKPADNLKIISPKSLDISIRVTLRMLDGWLEK